MSKRNASPWVVAGGAVGELCHCENCGQGLRIDFPQMLTIALAAMDAFCEEHASCTTKTSEERVPSSPQQWAAGRDTGISSMTIYSVIMGVSIDRADVPHDPDDFGRCYRLLQLFPAWKKRLDQVAERYPVWAAMASEWTALELLYEEALRTNSGETLYRRLQALHSSAA